LATLLRPPHYRDSTDFFPGGTSATDEGLLDAIVYGTNDDDAIGLLEILTPDGVQVNEGGSNSPDSISRVPDGGDPFDISRYVAKSPTIGVSNGSAEQSGFAEWAQGFPGIDAPNAIPDDGDFLSNAVQYALGLNPTMRDISSLPNPKLNENDQLEFSITKGQIAGSDPNLSYIVEVSANLGDWTTEGTEELANTNTELVVRYTGNAPEIYMRLKLVLE
jgi:hypothetical protein